MVNHPNRKQVRLSLSIPELQALRDLIQFAERQGYYPLTDYARAHSLSQERVTQAAVAKVNATWEATQS